MGRGSGVFLAGNAMGRLRALAGIGLALPRLSAGDFCRPRRQGDCLGNQLTVTDRTSAESSLALDFSATPFPVVVDWDGDSDEDLVVADERGLRYFERVGAGLVERVGAANPFGGINVSHPTPPAADWVDDTIAIAIADWDSDGDQDLVIGGSIVANFRFFERVAGGGLVELSGSNYPFQLHQQLYYYDGVHRGRCVPAFVDWDGDGDQDLIVGQLEARPLYFERLAPNVLQYRRGEGQDPFWHLALVADHWRVALYPVDMDLDGDVDLVVTSTAHRFVSSADMTVRVETQGLAQYFERLDNATLVERRGASQNPFEGIFGKGAMFVAFLDWNQDGQQDFVFGEEPANDTARLRYYEGSRKVVWEIDDENNPFFGVSQFNFPVPAFLDWDGDGDLDIVTVETGWVAYYDNVAAGFLAGPNWEPFWGLSLHFSLTAPAFADWDHDGNTDMLVFEGAPIPRLRLYARMPDGTLAAPYQFGILRASGVRQTPSGSLYMEYYYPSEAGTAFVDWDGDGELELVVLVMGKSHEVTFRYFQRAPGTETGLLERSGAENPFAGISFSIGSGYAGDDRVFAVPSFVDLDMDGDLDLVVSSAEVLLFFERNSSGLLERRDAPFEPRGEAGVFNCYTFVDWDGDTDPDIVVSARGSPLSLWVFGACTQPSPCSGNGLCTGGHGECKCLVGYVGASCSGCSANYYKRVDTQSSSTATVVCEPCPGGSETTAVCSQRGVCMDDILARGAGETATLRMLAAGTGECMCSEEAFNGTGCELGVCPAGTHETGSEQQGGPNYCAPCAAGRFSLDGGPCQDCRTGLVSAEGSGVCSACPDGERPVGGHVVCEMCSPGQTPVQNSDDCESCPAGQFSSAGICEVCGDGHQPLPSQAGCSPCLAGQFAAAGDICEPCGWGEFSPAGASACEECAPGFYNTGGADCIWDWEYFSFYGALIICAAVAWFPLLYTLRRLIRIVDMRETDGGALVTAMGPHFVASGKTIKAKIRGSGVWHFERNDAWLSFKHFDGTRLSYESPERTFAESSGGSLKIRFPQEWYKTKALYVPVSPLVFFVVVQLAYVSGCLIAIVVKLQDSNRRDMMQWLLLSAQPAGLILAALVAFLVRSYAWKAASPISRRIGMYRRRLLETNPNPSATPRGALRAVPTGSLRALLAMFEDFILDRNAYYLDPAVTRPVTEPFQLSVAEVMGSHKSDFFVSHFWGTPFKHFVRAITNHAQHAGVDDWEAVAYWVCFLSNNQWQIADELGGGDWRQSSFYLALQDSQCKGTCMVLDNKALPLTRSWCLFEVLQTYKLVHTRGEEFGGLTFCTSGGTIGIDSCFDTTLELAKRLSTLRMRDARASDKGDEAMILALVEEEEATSGETMDAFISGNMNATLMRAKDLFETETSKLEGILTERSHSLESVDSVDSL